jgi:hypothetical protein
MAVAALNYAESYQQGLQQTWNTRRYFDDLWNCPMNSTVQFINANTIKLPHLNVTNGRKPYDRETISTPARNYENSWENKTLSFDRYWDTLVDPVNIDETNMATTIANITNQYNRDEKIPEQDKYMISKLYSEKQRADAGAGNVSVLLTVDTVLEQFDAIQEAMDEAEVPADGRVVYITPHINTILKQAKELNRYLITNAPGNDVVNRRVASLDNLTFKVVPASRMKTLYDFTTGAGDAAGALQIDAMVIHHECMAAPEKYAFVGIDAPTAKTAGKWLYFERSYSDVFVFDKKSNGLIFITEPGV